MEKNDVWHWVIIIILFAFFAFLGTACASSKCNTSCNKDTGVALWKGGSR